MKNLFEKERITEVTERLGRLQPSSERLWGKMTPPQAMAHCALSLEWALGDEHPPRMFLGRLFGGFVKGRVMRDDKPIQRNAPTAPGLVISDERDLTRERDRLRGLILRFGTEGPRGCSTHPHVFFGRMTPDEWAILMYKHLDHHLRQFGV
ncbi:MAG: DUF1569 domain-containing protein [Gemmatimonadaceae bacterium]